MNDQTEFVMQHGLAAAFREGNGEIIVAGTIVISRVGALVRFAHPVVPQLIAVFDPADIDALAAEFLGAVVALNHSSAKTVH